MWAGWTEGRSRMSPRPLEWPVRLVQQSRVSFDLPTGSGQSNRRSLAAGSKETYEKCSQTCGGGARYVRRALLNADLSALAECDRKNGSHRPDCTQCVSEAVPARKEVAKKVEAMPRRPSSTSRALPTPNGHGGLPTCPARCNRKSGQALCSFEWTPDEEREAQKESEKAE
eukprot:GHVT01033976.1.p1 GENE.GHVT01033976.1~~GHVT01033976.1.p1  ORF type:complete len:171 (+),score=24.83 GHVT01033976.1:1101-1613(+)